MLPLYISVFLHHHYMSRLPTHLFLSPFYQQSSFLLVCLLTYICINSFLSTYLPTVSYHLRSFSFTYSLICPSTYFPPCLLACLPACPSYPPYTHCCLADPCKTIIMLSHAHNYFLSYLRLPFHTRTFLPLNPKNHGGILSHFYPPFSQHGVILCFCCWVEGAVYLDTVLVCRMVKIYTIIIMLNNYNSTNNKQVNA